MLRKILNNTKWHSCLHKHGLFETKLNSYDDQIIRLNTCMACILVHIHKWNLQKMCVLCKSLYMEDYELRLSSHSFISYPVTIMTWLMLLEKRSVSNTGKSLKGKEMHINYRNSSLFSLIGWLLVALRQKICNAVIFLTYYYV